MPSTHLDTVNGLDLTLDVATLLREGTAIAHAETENTEAAGWLTRGELDKDEYIRFLIILWHLYSNLEASLDQHATHPVLAPTYNPTLLSRAQAISSDIAHLLSTSESAWNSHPVALAISREPPAPLAKFIERIRALASSPDPSPLLAHAYVRYLGDLSGGQVIRRRIAKAYDLDPVSSLGTQFYEFQKLGGGGTAGIGDMRHIKVWYRDGMNKGVGDDQQLKAALVSEAIVAFQLNASLLQILRAPTPSKASDSLDLPNAPTETKSGESMVSVAGVLSFILAMGIAQFLLVTGGFFGDAGLEKWDHARKWIGNALGVSAAV